MAALATYFVEFATKGMEDVQSSIDGLKSKLSSVDGVAVALKGALGALAGITLFQGTAEGEYFAELLSQLTREIAAVFLPAMQLATEIVQKLLEAFRGLGGEGQNAIATIAGGLMMLAGGPVTMVLGFLVAGSAASEKFRESIGKVVDVLGRLASAVVDLIPMAIIEKNFETMAMVIENLLIPALEDLVSLLEHARRGAEMLGLVDAKSKDKRREVGAPGGQFEDVQATFRRVQEAALKTGTGTADPAERTAKSLENIDAKMGESLLMTIVNAIKSGATYIANALNPFSR